MTTLNDFKTLRASVSPEVEQELFTLFYTDPAAARQKVVEMAAEKGVTLSVDEVQINVVFESYLTGKVQKALFESHPYETVAYEMYGLLNSYNNVGMGKIGFLKNETNRIDFLKNLKKIFNTGHIRYNNYKGEKLNKIAVLGGSGSFAIDQAKKKGADAFITADLKYHQFFQADGEILLIDIGHYESEQYTKNLIFDYLTKKLPNFAIALSKTKTNPVNYI